MTNTYDDENGFLDNNYSPEEVAGLHSFVEMLAEKADRNEEIKKDLANKQARFESAKSLAAAALRERLAEQSNSPYLRPTVERKIERIGSVRI